jgi:hypothetical protein
MGTGSIVGDAPRGHWATAIAVAALALAALLATSRDFAMVFDEGFTVYREEILAEWFGRFAGEAGPAARAEALEPGVLETYWQFSREEPDGHPPFYALLGLAGWRLTRGLFHPLTAYRFGPMALTAATAGMACLFLSRRHGRTAGVSAALLLVFAPRVFSHAHYAHYDMPTSCLWLLAQMAFVKALGSWRWSFAFGLALGLAAATKFTGWFAVAAPLGWVVIYEWSRPVAALLGHIRFHGAATRRPGRQAGRVHLPGTVALVVGLVVAAAVLYAIQPPWWRDPVLGLRRFLLSNLNRERSNPLPAYYLGTRYEFGLPWHNSLVLTAATTPVLIQAAALLGLIACVARARSAPSGLIWPLSWGVLVVVRALPGAPGHDVERLLLPSLVNLPILAGIGIGRLAGRAGGRRPRRLAALALAAAALAECGVGIARVYPHGLSYYNVAIGGLPGAERAGLEVTYYWDALGPEFFAWARREAAKRGGLELMLRANVLNLRYLRAWGDLPPAVRLRGVDEGVAAPAYVLQRCRSDYPRYVWVLERDGHPIFRVSRQGVDLLRVYSFDESRAAFERAGDGRAR